MPMNVEMPAPISTATASRMPTIADDPLIGCRPCTAAGTLRQSAEKRRQLTRGKRMPSVSPTTDHEIDGPNRRGTPTGSCQALTSIEDDSTTTRISESRLAIAVNAAAVDATLQQMPRHQLRNDVAFEGGGSGGFMGNRPHPRA